MIGSSDRRFAEREDARTPLDIDDRSVLTCNLHQPDAFPRASAAPEDLRRPSVDDDDSAIGGYADELDFRAKRKTCQAE